MKFPDAVYVSFVENVKVDEAQQLRRVRLHKPRKRRASPGEFEPPYDIYIICSTQDTSNAPAVPFRLSITVPVLDTKYQTGIQARF